MQLLDDSITIQVREALTEGANMELRDLKGQPATSAEEGWPQ